MYGSTKKFDLVEFLFTFFIAVFVLFLIGFTICAVFVMYYNFSGKHCKDIATTYNVQHTYSIAQGCKLKVHDTFVHSQFVIPIDRNGKIELTVKPIFATEVK